MSIPEDDPVEAPPALGFASRKDRLTKRFGGAWGTSSQDFLMLVDMLYAASKRYADGGDGNFSPYTLAGVPTLLAAFRCLLIEVNDGVLTDLVSREDALASLAKSRNEISFLEDWYTIPAELLADLRLLQEVRNEIVHPSHRPGPEADNTPTYLRSLKDRGLLQSTGKEADYIWIGQLQSHRLFRWAWQQLDEAVNIVLREHGAVAHLAGRGFGATWSQYSVIDAS